MSVNPKTGRAKGYHYETGPDGKKHRVYNNQQQIPKAQGQGAYRTYAPRYSPKPRVFRGQGGYYDSAPVKWLAKNVPKGTFRSGGQFVAGPLGGFAGDMLSKIAGFGAYTVKSNSLINEGQSPAAMHSSSSSCIIRHREYITDVVSSSSANTFNVNSYSINPGLNASFPWLAPIAQQYQEYRVLGMVFEFKTLYADAIASAAANATIGGVIMATDYNVIGPDFVNKQQMDNTQYTTSDKPSCSFYHPIECKPGSMATNQLFVRSGAVPAGTDARLYDLGKFQIGSFGIAATSVTLGELWVSYEIELSKPILTEALGQDIMTDHFKLVQSGSQTVSVDNTVPLGYVLAPVAGVPLQPTSESSLGGTITSGTTYNFPPNIQQGTYLFYWCVRGTAAAVTLPGITFVNCSAITMWSNDTISANNVPVNTTTSSSVSYCVVVKVTGMNATIALAGGTLPTSITQGDFVVTEFNYNIAAALHP